MLHGKISEDFWQRKTAEWASAMPWAQRVGGSNPLAELEEQQVMMAMQGLEQSSLSI
jgi:hypothetical protein